MAGGQLISAADTRSNSHKRYSFLDRLENLALSAPELTFPPTAPVDRVDDDTIRRLSVSLQNLINHRHGLRQLPEWPIPTYDNGNVDAGTVRTASRPHSTQPPPKHLDVSVRRVRKRSDASILAPVGSQSVPYPRTSATSSDPEESLDAKTPPHFSRIRADVGSPRVSWYGGRRDTALNRSASSRESRSLSVPGSSATRRAKSSPRPGTAESQVSQTQPHQKSTGRREQRRRPSNQQASPKLQSRRRFRLIPSFKDLHAHAKSQAKRLTSEEKSPPRRDRETEPAQLISLHDALRGSTRPLLPLHDPSHDEQFTLEWREELEPHQSRKPLTPQQSREQQETDAVAHTAALPAIWNESPASAAPSVASSILDWEWPRPKTYTTLNEETYQRRKKVTSGAKAETGNQAMVRSPPPDYPLPPVPSPKQGFVRKQSARRLLAHAMGDANRTLTSTKHAPPATNNSRSKKNDRVRLLAASRGLSVDADIAKDDCGSGMRQGPRDLMPEPSPSPLNARFNQSKRSSKVHELKKRHLSMLVKECPVPAGNEASIKEPATVETNSPKVPGSATTTREFNSAPSTPNLATFRDGTPDKVGVVKANTSKSRTAKWGTPASRRGTSRQADEPRQDRTLAHSGVMVMVDSSPRQSRELRAGAFRVPGPPRRQSSLNKTKILSPPRRQPSSKAKKVTVSTAWAFDGCKRSNASPRESNQDMVPRQMFYDLLDEYDALHISQGEQSPSRASSILEPPTIHEGQYGNLSSESLIPDGDFNDKEYVPFRRIASLGHFLPRSQDRSIPVINRSRQNKFDQLHDEINGMVHRQRTLAAQRDLCSQPGLSLSKHSPRQATMSGCESRLDESTYSLPTREVLEQIETDFQTIERSPPLIREAIDNRSMHYEYDNSESSLSPNLSIRSMASESYPRKNSDASMTDPNDYDSVAHLGQSTGRYFVPPWSTPSDDSVVDTRSVSTKKKYSNMPFMNYDRSATIAGPMVDEIDQHERSLPTAQSVSEIELNHFLTEANQMDNAIDSFLQTLPTWSPWPVSTSVEGDRESVGSNIVDLQRIEDQMQNDAGGFGTISVVKRSSMM